MTVAIEDAIVVAVLGVRAAGAHMNICSRGGYALRCGTAIDRTFPGLCWWDDVGMMERGKCWMEASGSHDALTISGT